MLFYFIGFSRVRNRWTERGWIFIRTEVESSDSDRPIYYYYYYCTIVSRGVQLVVRLLFNRL